MFTVKKGDQVKILSGKDRTKTGKVLKVDQSSGRVTVEGLNLITRHEKPKKQGQKGQKLQISMPLNPSKLMLICPHCGKPARVSVATDDKGVKYRICKKCGKRI